MFVNFCTVTENVDIFIQPSRAFNSIAVTVGKMLYLTQHWQISETVSANLLFNTCLWQSNIYIYMDHVPLLTLSNHLFSAPKLSLHSRKDSMSFKIFPMSTLWLFCFSAAIVSIFLKWYSKNQFGRKVKFFICCRTSTKFVPCISQFYITNATFSDIFWRTYEYDKNSFKKHLSNVAASDHA